jgi:NADH-quinone oxidoreductase subunit A
MQPVTTVGAFSPWEPAIFSLTVFGLVILGLIAAMHFLSSWLGDRRDNPEKLRAYESGIIPTGSARLRYPVPFFLVAIFFLIFDVEGAYIFSWAVACEDLGWRGWLQISFFIFVLLLGLVYIWRKGGLEWGPTSNPSKREFPL